MKYLSLLLLLSCGLSSCGSLKPARHKHDFDIGEKCNYPGCGAWCGCGKFREYTTGKIFTSKKDAEAKLANKQ